MAEAEAVIKRWFEEVWNQGREDHRRAIGTMRRSTGSGTAPICARPGFRPAYQQLKGAFLTSISRSRTRSASATWSHFALDRDGDTCGRRARFCANAEAGHHHRDVLCPRAERQARRRLEQLGYDGADARSGRPARRRRAPYLRLTEPARQSDPVSEPALKIPAAADPVLGAPVRRATRIVFFVAGFGMAAWAPLVPFAKPGSNSARARSAWFAVPGHRLDRRDAVRASWARLRFVITASVAALHFAAVSLGLSSFRY